MNPLKFSRLATASNPLFFRFLKQNSSRNFWPVTPMALAALLEQLELPELRSKLHLCGIQPGCSMLLCDEAQQCQWLRLVYHLSNQSPANEVALLSPLGMALLGKNTGDEVKFLIAGRQCKFIIADIIRVRRQPANPEKSL